MLLPAQFVAEPLLVEHFKVRDSAGSVIGVAARHWNGGGAGPTTTWSVLIPSRGALVLSAPGEARGALEARAARGRLQRRQGVGRPSRRADAAARAKGAVTAGTRRVRGPLGQLHRNLDRRRRRRGRQSERHDRAQHRHESAAMKYLFVAIVGLVLGAAAAGVVLYFNPLTAKSAPMPSATDRVLRYSLPDHVLEFAVGEDARLFGQDTGDDSLWEETIDRTAVLGARAERRLESARGAREPAPVDVGRHGSLAARRARQRSLARHDSRARARCSCAPTRTPGRS